MKRKRGEQKDQVNYLLRDKNDPWSNHPEIEFGPTYPFFLNPEPRPILRAVKGHFD